jgi:two-component system sensor histidine kinase UhpB
MTVQSIVPGKAASARTFDRSTMSRPRGRLMGALWHGRSVRAQLLITFVLIDIVAVLVAGTVTILRARTATQVEMASSMTLAGLLVQEAVSLVPQDAPPGQILTSLPLRLRYLRHVRIVVNDAAGVPLDAPARSARAEDRESAPGWFASLIAPPIERQEVPVIVKGERIGAVVVLGEPRDEIAEVWDNTLALGAVAAGLNLLVVAILYVIFGRVLNPLTALSVGLLDLERRDYTVRLARPRQRELAVIVERFNALAEALDALRAENARLGQRLITAQDDERRRTARELHDEVGPCLFGLKANAASIAAAAGKLPEPAALTIGERVHDMMAIIDRLQGINRSLLNRLRPMALGHVPLRDLLADLVHDRARQNPHIALSFAAADLRASYGDAVDLTLYRCVQEGLTNAIRHAEPRTVRVELGDERATQGSGQRTRIRLTISDDGRGLAPGAPKGFGILGMEERVQALGGTFALERQADGGTCLDIVMPLPEGRGDQAWS